jgi:hypothetical protein
MELDTTGLLRMRLGEHAVHTWDIAVALDPAAQVSASAVDLLVDTLDMLAGRAGKPDGASRSVQVTTSSPERQFTLEIGEKVVLASEPSERAPDLRLPAEALVRLVYGRLDPAHTPAVETEGTQLDELRQVFPGF